MQFKNSSLKVIPRTTDYAVTSVLLCAKITTVVQHVRKEHS